MFLILNYGSDFWLLSLFFMFIAIDANELCLSRTNGVKSYTYNLLKSLINLDDKNKFVLYSKAEFRREFEIEVSKKKNFFHKVIKWYLPFWTYLRFPLELWRDQPDVLFMPIQAVPFFLPKCKIIVTVHDLAFLKFPSDFTFKNRLTLSFHTRWAINSAAKIIVPSQSTKKDIIKYYKVNPEKIRVVYHGVGGVPPLTPPTRGRIVPSLLGEARRGSSSPNLGEARRGKCKIQKNKYILFVGAIQPRKNIQGLIKAFEILKESCKSQFADYKLVIAGPKGWLYKDIFKKAQRSKYSKDIIFTGPVSKEELPEIYRNAEVFVLPSFYEGFGLPLLEAMARGIPVIASNISSMPEVAGRAAILINPGNTDEIAKAVYKVITDSDLKNKLVRKGFEQVQKFSWEKCAKETLEELTN